MTRSSIVQFIEEFEMAVADVMKMVQENDVKFVDFRFTDTRGKEQHVTVPVSHFDEDKFTEGHAFDGSSIAGWKGIQASDMLLMPDPDTANIDPFMDEPTLILTCDVDRAGHRQGLRPRPALHRQARRGLPEVHRRGRHRLLRPGTRILHLRLRHLA
jgi:glutamine synthetase